MARHYGVTLSALLLTLASNVVLAQEVHDQVKGRDAHANEPRGLDPFVLWNRERNAHACMMTSLFVILYPLGAMSTRFPMDRIPFLRNTYLRNKIMAIHAPIQIIGTFMIIAGMVLGIRIAKFAGYLNHPVHAHVVIGFLLVFTIILFQPALGILQHLHFKRTGGKSKFAFVHRWLGRGIIILGLINTGLGYQLAETNVIIPKGSYTRTYSLMGVFLAIWLSFVLYDNYRQRRSVAAADGGEKGAKQHQQEGLQQQNGRSD